MKAYKQHCLVLSCLDNYPPDQLTIQKMPAQYLIHLFDSALPDRLKPGRCVTALCFCITSIKFAKRWKDLVSSCSYMIWISPKTFLSFDNARDMLISDPIYSNSVSNLPKHRADASDETSKCLGMAGGNVRTF